MNEDLKKKAQELIESSPEVKSAVIFINQGERSAAMVAGESGEVINLLANALKQSPQVKHLFELAYFAISEDSK